MCLFGKTKGKYKQLVQSSWEDYNPRGEVQRVGDFDPLACTAYAVCNALEMIFNYKLERGLLTIQDKIFLKEEGYLNKNGKVNFSDRWLAKMSGTTEEGNYIYKVSAKALEIGLVPEKDYPYPKDPSWDKYYQDIDEKKLESKAQRFLKQFNLLFSWTEKKDWDTDIKESPIVITVFAWVKNDAGLYYMPQGQNPNHAVVKYRKDDWIFDSYRPFLKQLTPGNSGDWGIKFNIETKFNVYTMDIKNDILIFKNEGKGYNFGLFLNGKLLIGKTADVLGVFLLRNDGRTEGKTRTVTLNQWESLPHYNLKKEKIL